MIMKLVKRMICKFKGHSWGFYVHVFNKQDGMFGKDLKDVMYCKRCGYGNLRKQEVKK